MTEKQLKEQLFVLKAAQAEVDLLESHVELAGSLRHSQAFENF